MKMKVLLVAMNAKYIHSNLAVYSLKAYAEQYGNMQHEIIIKEYTINQYVEEILADIYKEQADMVGFSCYIWNIEDIIQIIRDLKAIQEDLKIFVGGPEVSYRSSQILKMYPPIDYVLCGEGEETFKQFLDSFSGESLKRNDIHGLAYREDNEIKINPLMQPIDLSKIPFVYQNGKDFQHSILYYETSRGCPYCCSYCLSSIDKRIRFRDLRLVKEELQFFLDHNVAQVKFVDRTFNCNPAHAMEIWKYIQKKDNGSTNFHFEIAADLLTEEELELLSKMRPGLVQLEIGVQSVNKKTLEAIHRRTDIQKIEQITGKIKKYHNIHQHLDLIAGLPYENYESFQNSFNQVYGMKPDQLQLGFLKVLYGAGICEESEKYGIVHSSRPPYEVLKTRWLTYDEILALKEVESVVEIYYNSMQFTHTIEALENHFVSPFVMYQKLGAFYQKASKGGTKHSRVRRYVLLHEFIQQQLYPQGEEQKQWEELLTFDFYLRENAKSRPNFSKDLAQYKEKIRRIYTNPKLSLKLKGYEKYSTKQIEHMTHMEVIQNRYFLFDYQNRNVLTKGATVLDVTEYADIP